MFEPKRNGGSNHPSTMSALHHQLFDGKTFNDPFLEPDKLAMKTVDRITNGSGTTASGTSPTLRPSGRRTVSNQVGFTGKTTFFSP